MEITRDAHEVCSPSLISSIANQSPQVNEQGYELSSSLPPTPAAELKDLLDLDETDGFSSDDATSQRRDSLEEEGSRSAYAHLSSKFKLAVAGTTFSPSTATVPPTATVNPVNSRPTLRSYVSAKELMMTSSTPSPSSPIKSKLESRVVPQFPHSRSNSHPDIQALVNSFESGTYAATVFALTEEEK